LNEQHHATTRDASADGRREDDPSLAGQR